MGIQKNNTTRYASETAGVVQRSRDMERRGDGVAGGPGPKGVGRDRVKRDGRQEEGRSVSDRYRTGAGRGTIQGPSIADRCSGGEGRGDPFPAAPPILTPLPLQVGRPFSNGLLGIHAGLREDLPKVGGLAQSRHQAPRPPHHNATTHHPQCPSDRRSHTLEGSLRGKGVCATRMGGGGGGGV